MRTTSFILMGFFSLMLIMLSVGCSSKESSSAPSFHEAVVQVDSEPIAIGEPLPLTLSVAHAPNETIELPELAHDETVEILSRERSRTLLNSNTTLSFIHLNITGWEPGNWVVFTNDLTLLSSTGTPARITLPELTLTVNSSMNQTNAPNLAEPTALMRLPRSWLPLVLGLLGIALLAVIAGLIALWVGHKPPKPPPVPPSARSLALKALTHLKSKGYIERQEAEPFFVELSDIVRNYIERRFGLHAPDRTTEEFIREAGESKLLQYEHQSLTRAFLEQADLIKFARANADASTMKKAYEAAEKLVLETSPGEGTVSPLTKESRP